MGAQGIGVLALIASFVDDSFAFFIATFVGLPLRLNLRRARAGFLERHRRRDRIGDANSGNRV
jgi:hypothetical protein